ncbi:MAG TPA: DnaJ C-terminal domain-containing protein [Nitrososphaerales archaeon]|nr:DnaJ C-terminal domain-containing protein [Nitrososphaerales archaeon]
MEKRVIISEGTDDGHIPCLRGEDEVGENGESSEDIYVVINMPPQSVFKRKENEICMGTWIDAIDATLGTEVRVPSLYGDVDVSVPSRTQPGSTFRIGGRGFPRTPPGGAVNTSRSALWKATRCLGFSSLIASECKEYLGCIYRVAPITVRRNENGTPLPFVRAKR